MFCKNHLRSRTTGVVFIMGLSIGHHVRSHMGLSCPLQSVVGKSAELNSTALHVKCKSEAPETISETIYNISIRKWLRNERDWREKIVRSSPEVSELSKDYKAKLDSNLSRQKLLSSKHFSGWELAWQLAMAESRIALIETEIRDARIFIGKQAGKMSRSNRRSKLHSRAKRRACNDNTSRASDSLQNELVKLLRQMVTLRKSNLELREQLDKPALELNLTVQQIVKHHLSKRADVTGPLYAVGIAIRNRYLENCAYHSRNKEIVLAGNEAAHNGNALADAILYHPSEANHRKDTLTYLKIYGLLPHTVWKHNRCKPFLQLVTWYGTVKRWHPHNFSFTEFAKAWPADFFKKYSKPQPEIFQADFARGNMTDLMKLIEAKYTIEAKQNRSKYQ
ncbi:hypothetical protein ONS95_008311 [Cadophora gregata]|uniref:uncharacterized protein n=1 Tax=Cadophora gregata TaxID=51156 RepID=UPI0026DB012C|nr:uncharacterized protein ONS95_008311 [Cadophora gregata]KAK0100358.1 hypothetical protein ONS96_007638 [Cadophora gregata f. sp. sojae]KAK0126731.1 hypothetical protein ONS95_008311 [Cadophora gregata]